MKRTLVGMVSISAPATEEKSLPNTETVLHKRMKGIRRRHLAESRQTFQPDKELRRLRFSPIVSNQSPLVILTEDKSSGSKELIFHHPNQSGTYVKTSYDAAKRICTITRVIKDIGTCSQSFPYDEDWEKSDFLGGVSDSVSRSLFSITPYLDLHFPSPKTRKRLRRQFGINKLDFSDRGLENLTPQMLPPAYRIALEFFQEASFLSFVKEELEGEGFLVSTHQWEIPNTRNVPHIDFKHSCHMLRFEHRFYLEVNHPGKPEMRPFYVGYNRSDALKLNQSIEMQDNSELAIATRRMICEDWNRSKYCVLGREICLAKFSHDSGFRGRAYVSHNPADFRSNISTSLLDGNFFEMREKILGVLHSFKNLTKSDPIQQCHPGAPISENPSQRVMPSPNAETPSQPENPRIIR